MPAPGRALRRSASPAIQRRGNPALKCCGSVAQVKGEHRQDLGIEAQPEECHVDEKERIVGAKAHGHIRREKKFSVPANSGRRAASRRSSQKEMTKGTPSTSVTMSLACICATMLTVSQ